MRNLNNCFHFFIINILLEYMAFYNLFYWNI